MLCTVFLDMYVLHVILKRQYFFCEVPFESGAQKESVFFLFCLFFSFSPLSVIA